MSFFLAVKLVLCVHLIILSCLLFCHICLYYGLEYDGICVFYIFANIVANVIFVMLKLQLCHIGQLPYYLIKRL